MLKNLTLNFRELKQKSVDLKSVLKSNQTKILIITLYLIGIWIGTVLYANNTDVKNLIQNNFNNLLNCELIKIFLILVTIKTGIVTTVFLSGFSACGLPISVGLPCIYGIICGVLSSCIYQNYKLNGVFFTLIIVIPFATVTALMITTVADNAINLSKQLVKAVAFGEAGKRGEAKKYFLSGVIIILTMCVIQLLQAFLISKPGEMILSL